MVRVRNYRGNKWRSILLISMIKHKISLKHLISQGKTVGKAKSKRERDSTRNKTHSVFVIERYQVLGINIMLLCHIQYSAKA